MPRLLNRVGMRYGRLIVVEHKGKDRRSKHLWLCKCDCGNEKLSSVTGWQLKSGHTQSCGCLNSEITAERNRRNCLRKRQRRTNKNLGRHARPA